MYGHATIVRHKGVSSQGIKEEDPIAKINEAMGAYWRGWHKGGRSKMKSVR